MCAQPLSNAVDGLLDVISMCAGRCPRLWGWTRVEAGLVLVVTLGHRACTVDDLVVEQLAHVELLLGRDRGEHARRRSAESTAPHLIVVNAVHLRAALDCGSLVP